MPPTIVIAIGATAPTPSPCTMRKTMSAGMLYAKPQRIDPARNRPMPSRMIGLRPTMSANRE